MKRWLPFIVILLIALLSGIYLLLNTTRSTYYPQTDQPGVIYREACAGCHGARGEGEHLIYPELAKEVLNRGRAQQLIMNGSMMMPAFIYIKGDTLKALLDYVVGKKFIQ